MQIPKLIAEGIRDGRVTCAYRRWDAPRVKVGGTQLTSAGVVVYDAVTPVRVDRITRRDALAAGQPDVQKLRKWLSLKDSGRVYRIDLHYGGPDPRWELREDLPDETELRRIDAALGRLDGAKRTAEPETTDGTPTRNPTGPWTLPILRWIRDNPAVVSKELAKLLHRELQPMKTDIRKLKALGLTISLEVGYRISPRGAAYLDWKDRRLR